MIRTGSKHLLPLSPLTGLRSITLSFIPFMIFHKKSFSHTLKKVCIGVLLKNLMPSPTFQFSPLHFSSFLKTWSFLSIWHTMKFNYLILYTLWRASLNSFIRENLLLLCSGPSSMQCIPFPDFLAWRLWVEHSTIWLAVRPVPHQGFHDWYCKLSQEIMTGEHR